MTMRAWLVVLLLSSACGQDPSAGATRPGTRPDPGTSPATATAPRTGGDVADLVFAALGNWGNGGPGQRRVADTLARLAPAGPLDFVLLLGDGFRPQGVASARDPLWRSRFEEVYDPVALAVPFYPALGPADLKGDVAAQIEYGKTNRRWTMQSFAYDFQVRAHGRTFHFFAADTTSLVGPAHVGATRAAQRLVVHPLEQSKADWKIVFGHRSFYAEGKERSDGLEAQLFRDRLGVYLERHKVDVYIASDREWLELIEAGTATLHVLSGAGAGADTAGPARRGPLTRFQHAGGGFVWFRFDGRRLAIEFRDAGGDLLHTRELVKP